MDSLDILCFNAFKLKKNVKIEHKKIFSGP